MWNKRVGLTFVSCPTLLQGQEELGNHTGVCYTAHKVVKGYDRMGRENAGCRFVLSDWVLARVS